MSARYRTMKIQKYLNSFDMPDIFEFNQAIELDIPFYTISYSKYNKYIFTPILKHNDSIIAGPEMHFVVKRDREFKAYVIPFAVMPVR